MKIKDYIEKIVNDGKEEDMEALSDMLVEIIYGMKEPHYDKYKCYKMKLYEMAYDGKIDKETASEWVESMSPIGQKWTIEETTKFMTTLNYNLNEIDYYIVSNMMYNDYYDLVNDNEELALKLAKNWLEDKDANKNKLFNYYKYIVIK